MALTTVSFDVTYNYTTGEFDFTDTSDYAGQSVAVANVLGNFEITDPNGTVVWNNTDYSTETGTAQSGGASSITLAVGASATNDYYNNLYVVITGGTGSGQVRRVSDYNGTTKVVTTTAAWATNPDNTSTYKFAFSDVFVQGALTNQTVINLSLGVDGAPQAGNYSIVYTVKDTSTGAYVSDTLSYSFDFVPPIPSLGYTIDCIAPRLIATDTTNYIVDNVVPTITRTHTLYYPPSLNISPITGTATDISTSNFYTPATFQHTLSAVCTWVFPTYTVTVTLESEQFINVTCDAQLCDIYCCVATLYNNWKANVGVNKVLADKYMNQLVQVAALMILIKQAYECGKSDAVAGYVSDILRIANCEAGCGCTSDAPIPVTGLGVGNDNIVEVQAGNGVTVTSSTTGNTTTYTVSVSSSLLNTINSLHNQIVTGTVSNVVTYNSGTYTYNVAGSDLVLAADTQLPTTTSLGLTTTQSGGIDTQWEVKYIGRNYKELLNYAPASPATTATANEEIVGSSYSMVEDVATIAQDTIRLKGIFAMVGSTVNSTLRMRIGGVAGTALFSVPLVYGVTSGASKPYFHNRAVITVDVTRITSTTARVSYSVAYLLAFSYSGGAIAHTELADSYVLTVPDFDNGTNVWCCTIDDASAGQTELRNFSLEFIPKV